MSALSLAKLGTIDLGRQGENLATTIEIDVSPLLAKWPGATISLLVKRKGDTDPYFAETTVSNGVLKWPITKVETAVSGDGKIEIQAVSGSVIAKSVTATIRVSSSLSGSASTEAPDTCPSWVDTILGALGSGGSSTEAAQMAVKSGLTVAIIGDSISTHPKKNVSEIVIQEADVGVELSSYITYYDIDKTISLDGETSGYTITSDDVGTELTFTPCSDDVGKTLGTPLNYNSITSVWWQVAADALGFEPIAACWSGSSITAHTASSSAKAASYAWHDHTIRTLGKRTPGSMERTAPDVVLIYRGTNDLSHSTKVRLTEGYFDTVAWTYPESDLLSDSATYGYKEGLALTIQKIRTTYPKARIVLCTCNVFKRSHYETFPTHNGYFSIPQMNTAIREVAEFFGCQTIDLDRCGITWENCYDSGYITDSATTPTHPNATGHALMGLQAISDLINKVHICDIDPIAPTTDSDSGTSSDSGSSTTSYIVDPWACWADGAESATSGYFAFVDYPVEGGATYSIPYGRNYFFEDSSYTYISGGQGGGSSTLQVTAPDNAAYITICFKSTEISTSAAAITLVSSSTDSDSGTSSDSTQTTIGDLQGTLMEGYYLGTSSASTLSGSAEGTTYFVYKDIAVEAETTYSAPYSRNTAFYQADGTYISGATGGGSSTATLTTPANAGLMTVTYKYADLDPADVTITKT